MVFYNNTTTTCSFIDWLEFWRTWCIGYHISVSFFLHIYTHNHIHHQLTAAYSCCHFYQINIKKLRENWKKLKNCKQWTTDYRVECSSRHKQRVAPHHPRPRSVLIQNFELCVWNNWNQQFNSKKCWKNSIKLG